MYIPGILVTCIANLKTKITMNVSRGLRHLSGRKAAVIMIVILLSACTSISAQRKTQVVATVKEKDIIPEGIAYDQKTKTLFLSSINKSKIVAINAAGKVDDFVASGANGLRQVLGMKVHNGQLWACNNTPEYDTTSREANVH